MLPFRYDEGMVFVVFRDASKAMVFTKDANKAVVFAKGATKATQGCQQEALQSQEECEMLTVPWTCCPNPAQEVSARRSPWCLVPRALMPVPHMLIRVFSAF